MAGRRDPPEPVGRADAPDVIGPEHRLVVYGTLRPGGENHHLVADLGRWEPVHLIGHLGSWGRYPAFIPDAAGDRIGAELVTSDQLPARWSDLDRFEGPGYRRVVLRVEGRDGPVDASCYILAERPGG